MIRDIFHKLVAWWRRDLPWRDFTVSEDGELFLMDGTPAGRGQWVWRRRFNGQWQYKAMTEAEAEGFEKMWAIK